MSQPSMMATFGRFREPPERSNFETEMIGMAGAKAFLNRLDGWLDLPAGSHEPAQRFDQIRDRVLAGLAMGIGVMLPLLGVYYLAIGFDLSWRVRWQSALVLGVLGLCHWLALWCFRCGVPRALVMHCIIAIDFLAIAAGVVVTGGTAGSSIPTLLLTVPALSFCIGGKRAGIAWTLIVLFTLEILDSQTMLQGLTITRFSHDEALQIDNIVWALSMVTIGGVMLIYERQLRIYNWRLSQERELYYRQANRDKLTGLANRRRFEAALEQSVEAAKADGGMSGLIYIDLDNFKPVNDEFGHEVGDWALRQVGNRIAGCLRAEDLAARIGGDEFGIVISTLDNVEQLESLVDRIASALSGPLVLDGCLIAIGASIGFAVYPENAGDSTALARHADNVMYDSKRRRKHCVEVVGTNP